MSAQSTPHTELGQPLMLAITQRRRQGYRRPILAGREARAYRPADSGWRDDPDGRSNCCGGGRCLVNRLGTVARVVHQPAVLDSVGPAATVGSGFRFLGAHIRQFTYTRTHTPIGSVDGYPPSLPDTLQPVAGFPVSIPCQRATFRSTYTEPLIGFGRGTGIDGGGWHRIVTLGYNMLICGIGHRLPASVRLAT